MKALPLVVALALAGAATLTFAQSLEQIQQRDINQQQRIENGLQSGQLNTREAALLEREQARVDRLQARDLKDGKLSAAERAQITAAQNRASRDIARADNNGVGGNPFSASSQRMQGAVQRNINQEQRIENGIRNDSLTNREVGRLDRGQAQVAAREYRDGRDGRVGAGEAAAINHAQDRKSERIYALKHNAAHRP